MTVMLWMQGLLLLLLLLAVCECLRLAALLLLQETGCPVLGLDRVITACRKFARETGCAGDAGCRWGNCCQVGLLHLSSSR